MAEWIKNWFSNMLPCDSPIVDEMGVKYKTVENYYQAAKMPDRARREKLAAVSPFASKKLVRTPEFTVSQAEWLEFDTRKLKVMEAALRQKFARGTSWYPKLMATGTDEIVEWNNWGDVYWGRLMNRIGYNHLGQILMKLRAEFRNEEMAAQVSKEN